MRTDVKIGIAVGLLVALGAIVYFVLSEPAEAPQAAEPGLASKPPEIPSVRRREREIDEGLLIPRLGGAEAETETPARAAPRILEPELMSSAPKASADDGKMLIPTLAQPDAAKPPAPAKPRTIAIPPAPKLATLARKRTYVVQKGDRGFWGIAQKEYGDGKYWPLIAKANPNADSNALRAGQRLIIPPKPAPGPRTLQPTRREPVAAAAGTSGTYVVVKGDNGFWDVAKKMYGNGKYWRLISSANPGVESGALQPGQRLIIPPRSEVSPGPTPATPTTPKPAQPTEPTDARPVFD